MWARYYGGVLGSTDKTQINLLVHQNRWMTISSIRTVNTMPDDYASAKFVKIYVPFEHCLF